MMFGTRILEERKSKFNGDLKVVRTLGLGTYIQAGNLTQSGGIIESMWRSTIRHIRYTNPYIHNVLILGLGGGTVVKQICKNWPGAKITGVDIDPIIVELGIRHLALDKSKVKIIIGDALNSLNLPNFPNQKFDLIIVDLYNGDQFPKKFESQNYTQLVSSLLSNDGVVVFNRLYYKDKKIEAEKFGKKLKKVFRKVEEYFPLVNIMYICRD
jgi:spermidine synthase